MTLESGLDSARRRHLLQELNNLASDADAHPNLRQVFLPLRMHTDTLRPDKLVVRGERGAGKTALFRVLRELTDTNESWSALLPASTVEPMQWIEGFSERGPLHPGPEVLDAFALSHNDSSLRSFWLGHLVGRLATAFPKVPPPQGEFLNHWRHWLTNPRSWVETVEEELPALSAWLDTVDSLAAAEGRWVIVAYDHLDKIGLVQPEVRRRFVAALLALALSQSNRFARIRMKVFLREDLYQSTLSSSPDLGKLEHRSVRIQWSTEDLYRLLVRHMASSDDLRDWLGHEPSPISLHQRVPFGFFPPDTMPEQGPNSQFEFVKKLAGELMGEGVKKGYTYRWIPNHLQDAHRRLSPRSLLNLVAFAARNALERGPRATGYCLIHPTELQAALELTSRYRVNELREEHPVVQRLENLRGITLLADWALVEGALATPATRELDDGFGQDGRTVSEELINLGVLRKRDDGRADLPDIYRYAYGIKRKGGATRAS